jgi:hypothetical protein
MGGLGGPKNSRDLRLFTRWERKRKKKKLEEGKETLPMCLMGKMPLHGVAKSVHICTEERGCGGG